VLSGEATNTKFIVFGQADSLTKKTKTKLTILSKGDNVIIPIPSVDRGHADERNIKGVVTNVNEHGGYKIYTYQTCNFLSYIDNAQTVPSTQ
jgi:hypothetical protein